MNTGLHNGVHARATFTPIEDQGLTVGPLLQIHGHYQKNPGEPVGQVELRGSDLSVNLAPDIGWRAVLGHVRFEPHLYAGLHTRWQFTHLIDEAHDVDERKRLLKGYSEVGSGLAFGVRIGPRWEVGLDVLVPMWIGRTPAIPLGFLQSGPSVGLTLGLFI